MHCWYDLTAHAPDGRTDRLSLCRRGPRAFWGSPPTITYPVSWMENQGYWQSTVVMKHEVGHMFAVSDNYSVLFDMEQPDAIMSGGSQRQPELTESDVQSLNAAFRLHYLGEAEVCDEGWFVASFGISGTACWPREPGTELPTIDYTAPASPALSLSIADEAPAAPRAKESSRFGPGPPAEKPPAPAPKPPAPAPKPAMAQAVVEAVTEDQAEAGECAGRGSPSACCMRGCVESVRFLYQGCARGVPWDNYSPSRIHQWTTGNGDAAFAVQAPAGQCLGDGGSVYEICRDGSYAREDCAKFDLSGASAFGSGLQIGNWLVRPLHAYFAVSLAPTVFCSGQLQAHAARLNCGVAYTAGVRQRRRSPRCGCDMRDAVLRRRAELVKPPLL